MREPEFYLQCADVNKRVDYCIEFARVGCPQSCWYAKEQSRLLEKDFEMFRNHGNFTLDEP
jgi:hypothetical protein